MIKKDIPFVKIIVSYADPEQGHTGVIYKATNWTYIGKSQIQYEVICPITGGVLHKRIANARYGTIKGLEKSKPMFKYKYAYAFDKSTKEKLNLMKKDFIE